MNTPNISRFLKISAVLALLGALSASAAELDDARRPISNPTLFDQALPTTNVHPIFMHQTHPDTVETTLGELPVGGDFQLYALQFEIAFSDRLSLVAVKDGYIDFNPNSTFSETEGFANLAAGLKYLFLRDDDQGIALSGSATVEIPIGDDDVWQGEGDGALNLIGNALKVYEEGQLAASVGIHIPFDSDEDATTSHASVHYGYYATERFMPLIEANWYHVWDAGEGANRFPAQVGGLVPAVAQFEGGDLINLGSANAGDNRDIVTIAIGARFKATENGDIGLAYEIPLTDEEANLMESRVTLDYVISF